ncbi:unnamed protein product [Caenorhabditis angaria]|uniref:Latrophilin Cirl n=1 Tax=Caenorhabditis angaria TaxID=860376 RepID=A0A9P1IAM2_9PELO|nr:unnamed protein product [Caenorhabditis angaria]
MRGFITISFLLLVMTVARGVSAEKQTVDENGTYSHTVCDGSLAELSCPTGTVISIVLGNYGRFSTQVCLGENDIPTISNCQNHKTKSILEKKCNGHSSCDVEVSIKTFIEDPCPSTPKYLEYQYRCVVSVTTSTSTTTSATTTSIDSEIEEEDEDAVGNVAREEAMLTTQAYYCAARQERGVHWAKTRGGLTVTTTCPEGTRGKQTWQCLKEGIWKGEHPNTAGCESDWIGTKSATFSEVESSEDSTGIPELLRKMVAETRRPLVGGDLPQTILLLERIGDIVVEDLWTRNVQKPATKGIVEVTNFLVRKSEIWESFDATKRREFAARILLLTEKMMVASSENMASIDSNIIAQPSINCEVSHKIKMSSQPTDYVLFPSSAVWGPQDVDNVNIPREAITQISTDETQVYFTSFDNLGTQMTPKDIIIPAQLPETEPIVKQRKIVSKVIGATLIHQGKVKKVDKLKNPIRLTFYHSPSKIRHLREPKCVWWNFHQLDWSPEGCSMSQHNSSMTVCECNHLTHFAVLMDVHGIELNETDETILIMLTYIGCGISIVCLFLTFFAYLIFSKNGGDRVFIHENLCLSLAIAEITFLAGITKTDDSLQCGIIAATLQYLFLCALTWMLIEGYHIYRMLVEVFPSDPRRLVYFIIGYFAPAFIVLSGWIYSGGEGFGNSQYCWLDTNNQLIWFFVGPASLILLINSIVLIKTLCTVYQHSSGGYMPCRHDVDSGRPIRSWVKGSMALGCLLGVTWSFGLLWVDDNKSVLMAYIFTIANSLQGLFIFLFHVMFSDKMRKDAEHWFYRRGCTSVGSSANSSPNKRGTRQIRADQMSPGMGSSSGSEFLYPSSEKYQTNTLDTTNRLIYNQNRTNNSMLPHPNQIPPQLQQQYYQYHQQLNQMYEPGTYDYATIAYGDMHPGTRIAAPPAYQRLAAFSPEIAAARYAANHYQHHRPPPEFSPPPPPAGIAPIPNNNNNGRNYGSAQRRPPSSKMSDDSAYSDGGSSSMLTTEVTPQGQTVLRIDLNKPNMYCQEL